MLKYVKQNKNKNKNKKKRNLIFFFLPYAFFTFKKIRDSLFFLLLKKRTFLIHYLNTI